MFPLVSVAGWSCAYLMVIAAAILSNSSAGHAGSFTAYGPRDYLHQTGEPVELSDRFTVRNPDTDYTLEIHNGGYDGIGDRISSAVITLNGVEVVGPDDFKQNERLIERSITLSAVNELTVELHDTTRGGSITVRITGIDDEPPTISVMAVPPPNAAGWNDSDVTVGFVCDDVTSGIDSCPDPVIVTAEGTGQPVSATAVDLAGNSATATVDVYLDKTKPSISVMAVPPPNAAGWNNSDVTVDFVCDDVTSGIDSCPDPVIVTAEGAGQPVSATAVDLAGNSAIATVDLYVDKTKPSISVMAVPPPNAAGRNNSNVTVSFDCADRLSGVADCAAIVIVATENVVQTVSASAATVVGSTADDSLSVSIGKTPPEVEISSPSAGRTLDDPELTVIGTLNELVPGTLAVECDSSVATPTNSTFECKVSLFEGPIEFIVEASDVAGNAGTASVGITLITGPEIASASSTNLSLLNANPIIVEGTVDDDEAAVDLFGVPGMVVGETWSATDGASDTGSVSHTVTVTEAVPNDAPLAEARSVATAEDTAVAIMLAGSDVDGDPLTFTMATGPAAGSLSGTAPNLTYTPDRDFNGTDSFTYTATDGRVAGNAVTVSITVTPVNDAPLVAAQSVATAEDTAVAIMLAGSDVDGDPLTFAMATGPAAGNLSGTAPNLTYTPDRDFNGTDSFTYTATDGRVAGNAVTVSITVTPVNDAPLAEAQSVATAEDTAVAIMLAGGAVDGDPLTFTMATGPAAGSLSGTAPNLTYTPDRDFNGTDSFTYTATDGRVAGNAVTVSITVTPVNDAPLAEAQSVATAEDTAVAIMLAGGDVDGDPLTFAMATGPAAGNLSGTAPNLTYTPDRDFNGTDSFTYTATDGRVAGNAVTVSITVTPVNDAPLAAAQSVATAEDTAVAIMLAGGDVDGDPLTFTMATGPADGSLSGTAPNLTYTPDRDFNGTDSFTYTANDGRVAGNAVTVSITVTPVNDAPLAAAQSVATAEDTAVAIMLAGNDVDGDPLTFTMATGPAAGSLSGTAPNLTYTPDRDFNGTDSFTYTANDGTVDSAAVTVAITVTPVNDAPLAAAQSVATAEDTAVAIMLAGSDVDGDPLTFTMATGPAAGSLSGTAPNLTYTPDRDFNGTDSFTYTATDGTVDSAAATVAITVAPVNDAPLAEAQSVATAEDMAVAIMLAGGDVDGDPLTFTMATGPADGSLSGTAPNLTYTPDRDFNGTDSFTYTATDGRVAGNAVTVSITVTPVNDAPLAAAQSVATAEDMAVAIMLAGSDVDGDPLTFTMATGPAAGSLSGTAPNLTYTPDRDFNGTDSFTYTADDGRVAGNAVTVSITVTPVNDDSNPEDRPVPDFLADVEVGAAALPSADAFVDVACGESLSGAIREAKSLASSGRNVRVVLAPCVYRETLLIYGVHAGSIEVVAEVPHTAIISGADVFDSWSRESDAWSAPWPYDFGPFWPSGWPSFLPQDEVLKRTETFFMDGVRLTQVARFGDLVDGSFFIDEGQSKVFLKTAADPNFALVEGTVRDMAIRVENSEHVALRGLVQERAASNIQARTGTRVNNASDILIENMIIRENSGKGLSMVKSRRITTRGLQVTDNGYSGYGCYKTVGLLSEDDTITGSNWRGAPFGMTGWAIAGIKCFRLHDALFRRLTITDNLTRGFWLDIDIEGIVIDDPVWNNNLTDGTFVEKARGPILIRGGDISDNGRAGLRVSASTDVTVEGVTIENNNNYQIRFSGQTNFEVTNWETGESYVLNTDDWTILDSDLAAFGSQVIVSSRLPPATMFASGNICTTDNPVSADNLVCE